MATTPTRQKTINDIRNNRINTISTEIQLTSHGFSPRI